MEISNKITIKKSIDQSQKKLLDDEIIRLETKAIPLISVEPSIFGDSPGPPEINITSKKILKARTCMIIIIIN